MHTMPSLAVDGHAAVRVLKSRCARGLGNGALGGHFTVSLPPLLSLPATRLPSCSWVNLPMLPPLLLGCRRTTKKRRKQRQLKQRGGAPEGSSVLFRWLFRTCAAWLVWEWVRVSSFCWVL